MCLFGYLTSIADTYGTSQVFSSVNIGDSKRMQRMTEAAVRDSAGKLSCILRVKDVESSTSLL